MTRKAAALALFLPLGGCVTVPSVHLPHFGSRAVAAPTGANVSPAATLCTADMTEDLEDKPPVPDGASIPAAETAQASAGFAIYLAWLKSLSDWGDDGWARAKAIRDRCTH